MGNREKDYIQRYESAKDVRTTWDPHFQEVSNFSEPQNSSIITTKQRGGKRTTELFCFKAARAKKKMAAGFYSHLCPVNQRWFVLRASDRERNNRPAVKTFRTVLSSLLVTSFISLIHQFHSHSYLSPYQIFILRLFGSTLMMVTRKSSI